MVLHPLDSPAEIVSDEPVPAWAAVAERQKRQAATYWLISQPDHARLAGELASNFRSPDFPAIEPLVATAIGAHDAGWGLFAPESTPSEVPFTTSEGKPLAFIEFGPEQFVRAWTGSIERAESICAAGGIIVSQHFCELGNFRLKSGGLSEEDGDRIRSFEQREATRQERLMAECSYSEQELSSLLEALKFCDLLSLYLCSGSQHEVEIPIKLSRRPVRVRREGEICRLDPSPFQNGDQTRVVSLSVRARRFPVEAKPELATLSFLLA